MSRAIWLQSALLMAGAGLASASPAAAQDGCYDCGIICGWGSSCWEGCEVVTNGDGSSNCTQPESGCSTSGDPCRVREAMVGDGTIFILASTPALAPAGSEAERYKTRECDGAIVARYYPEHVVEKIRRSAMSIEI